MSSTAKSETGAQPALEFLVQTAEQVRTSVLGGKLPRLRLPVRSLNNVRYDPQRGYFELGQLEKVRTLSLHTVKVFAQTLRLMALSKQMVKSGDFASKREAYYVSKNWGACRFSEQRDSDSVMDDIEAYASRYGISREQLRFFPEEHGGSVVGHLTILERTAEGSTLSVDCRSLGSGSYTVPRSVDHLEFQSDAEFVLVIETGGMYQRLNHHRYWAKARCILVEAGGVPSRATRRFVRRLSDSMQLPVYCFVDCDPYGFANIYRTLKAGSGNAAHVSQFLSVPQARYLGVTPQDIIDFGLQDATQPLKQADVKRAKDALKNDPFFVSQPRWQQAIVQLLEMGVRAEQQALAKWGLNYVIEEYLPKKLKQPELFLP